MLMSAVSALKCSTPVLFLLLIADTVPYFMHTCYDVLVEIKVVEQNNLNLRWPITVTAPFAWFWMKQEQTTLISTLTLWGEQSQEGEKKRDGEDDPDLTTHSREWTSRCEGEGQTERKRWLSDGAWEACFHLKHLQPHGRVNEDIVMAEHGASMSGCTKGPTRGWVVCDVRRVSGKTASLSNTIWVQPPSPIPYIQTEPRTALILYQGTWLSLRLKPTTVEQVFPHTGQSYLHCVIVKYAATATLNNMYY